MGSLQEFIISLMTFINNVLLPFLFGLALLFFVWNAFRFFILGSSEQASRDKAKQLALYSIAAFVFLVSVWGIVNLLVNGLGLSGDESIVPDYIRTDRFHGDWWDNCRNNPGATDCR